MISLRASSYSESEHLRSRTTCIYLRDARYMRALLLRMSDQYRSMITSIYLEVYIPEPGGPICFCRLPFNAQ
jgi:hypothetical protein